MPRSSTSATNRIAQRLDRARGFPLFLIVAGPLFALYLVTAAWSHPVSIDAFTNVLTAHSLAADGSFQLDAHANLVQPDFAGNVGWVIEGENGPISKYPPGAPLHAAPMYLFARDEPEPTLVQPQLRPEVGVLEVKLPPVWPAAVTSAAIAAGAIGVVALSFSTLVSGRTAVAGAYLAGLGTSAWSVAADTLWQHGPGMLWIAVASLLAARTHVIGSGLAYGIAVTIRPLTGLIALGPAAMLAFRRRFGTLLGFALAIGGGVLALVAYNTIAFGEPSLSGGYVSDFRERAQSASPVWYLKNIAGGLFSPTRGFLLWSPFLLLLLPGLPAAWRRGPDWVRGPAVGAVLYLLVQYRANRYSGGDGFDIYRYPLEPLVAAAPLLLLSYRSWVEPRPLARRAFVALSAVGIAAHLIAAI